MPRRVQRLKQKQRQRQSQVVNVNFPRAPPRPVLRRQIQVPPRPAIVMPPQIWSQPPPPPSRAQSESQTQLMYAQLLGQHIKNLERKESDAGLTSKLMVDKAFEIADQQRAEVQAQRERIKQIKEENARQRKAAAAEFADYRAASTEWTLKAFDEKNKWFESQIKREQKKAAEELSEQQSEFERKLARQEEHGARQTAIYKEAYEKLLYGDESPEEVGVEESKFGETEPIEPRGQAPVPEPAPVFPQAAVPLEEQLLEGMEQQREASSSRLGELIKEAEEIPVAKPIQVGRPSKAVVEARQELALAQLKASDPSDPLSLINAAEGLVSRVMVERARKEVLAKGFNTSNIPPGSAFDKLLRKIRSAQGDGGPQY